tara:strand:- start:355 stop:522 length:168 start_codon:yes stop_codon:yes gene_type:complete
MSISGNNFPWHVLKRKSSRFSAWANPGALKISLGSKGGYLRDIKHVTSQNINWIM